MSKISPENVKELDEKINILQTLEQYLFQALQINEITANTYFRISSAIRYMIVSFDTVKRFARAKSNYSITLESMSKINQMAKSYDMDTYNIEIRVCIGMVKRMLTEYINAVMKRSSHEMVEQDVDKLLVAIKKLNKMIDG